MITHKKYGMMGGLVQKPVVPSSWASDWLALPQQLSFWSSDWPVLPAAEILIGPKPRKAEIDEKAPLVLATYSE